MRNRLLLLALAASLFACDSSNPVAPGGTSLTVIANPTLIPLDGTSTISITGFRPDGNPLFPGTQIRVTTSLGVVENDLLEVGSDGRAETRLRADGVPGMANVTAFITTTSGGGGGGGDDGMGGGGTGGTSSASVAVQIGDSDTTRLTVALTVPTIVEIGQSGDVVAVVRNADGTTVGAGQTVEFRTTLGTIEPTAQTNADGQAAARFTAGNVPGTASITASAGSSAETMGDIMIGVPSLILTANPTEIDPGSTAVVTIVGRNSNGGALTGNPVVDLLAEGGTISPSTLRLDDSGGAAATFEAGEDAGPATVRALMAGLPVDAATVSIDIRDAVATINLVATPGTVSRSNNEPTVISLSAAPFNAANQPAEGVQIVFSAESDVANSAPPGTLASGGAPQGVGTNGAAADSLTITPTQLTNYPGNTFRVVASSGNIRTQQTIQIVP